MDPLRWQAVILSILIFSNTLLASPARFKRIRRQTLSELEQEQKILEEEKQILEEGVVFGPDVVERGRRDKRTARLLLNVLFWKINTLIQIKTRLLANFSAQQSISRATSASANNNKPQEVANNVEEEDVPDFDSNRVQLDIPGEIFGTGFNLITEISKIVGEVILNTARRTQRFVEAVKPAIAKTLGYKISALTGASSISTNTAENSSDST